MLDHSGFSSIRDEIMKHSPIVTDTTNGSRANSYQEVKRNGKTRFYYASMILLATFAFFMTPGSISDASAAIVTARATCGNPEPKTESQRVRCGRGFIYYEYISKYTESNNGASKPRTCYKFYATVWSGCALGNYYKTVCK